ncbi:wall-associated receptor kinase-like 20 isoform X2 [Tripterygium wilfordii]|uniref:wall-associated receptor kinase-like 20 isoform X2 n=1 Tax=Tripterygium wilfordii TaxID=458696 RepID=UPI0018F80147|nr:wall-associated receptor kinase-like 20 isoform X2 [Tripterygium wilfordii]
MEKNLPKLLLILTVAIISSSTRCTMALRRCGNCGRIPVPYPLSTGQDCGDQSYKIRCTAGTLWLDTLGGSSYTITSINLFTQRIIIRPASLAGNACVTTDYHSQGIQLDDNLPFNITSSNTILLLNCTDAMLHWQVPLNCSITSICHDYIRENAPVCKAAPLCCAFNTGGSQTAYVIRVQGGGCAAYQSFLYKDINAGLVKKWPEPGLEIQWALPREPVCKTPLDCKDLLFSTCLADPVSTWQNRCFCNAGFKWDPVNGVCQSDKCHQCNRCASHLLPIFTGAAVGAVGVLLIISGTLLFSNNHRMKKEAQKNLIKERKEILNAKYSGKSARIFTGKEIIKATNNFSKDNLIGSGGFGEVFKGILDDGTVTAVKRAKLGNTKGTDQVLNEVRILCQVNHRSLVRLLGCCVDLEQPIMIYDYIPNGTLFDHLHSHHSGKRTPLTWQLRLHIAHQTAEGLAYLHSAALPPIYHRDVKSSNILLDEKLNAKVSDFGLSRLVERTETNDSHIFTGAQGTLGYLDPEYYRNFQLTDKSDVYSFGVVLLELLTSNKAIDFNREEEYVNLVVYIKKIMGEERLMDVVDPVLKEEATKYELETIKALGYLAGACVDDKRQNRPSMKEVSDEIEYVISTLTAQEISESKQQILSKP